MSNILLARVHTMYSRWQRMSTPPLGIMYLAAVLKAAGHEVRAIDGILDPNWQTSLLRLTADWRPDVVGVSLLSLDIDRAADTVRSLREAGSSAFFVGGGPGATHADATTKAYLDFDAVVHGEGEQALLDLLAARTAGRDLRSVAGLSIKTGGEYHITQSRPPIADVDALPFPDTEVLPLSQYFGKPSMDLMFRHPRWGVIMTSRSCPYNCLYCAHAFGRGYRPRSAANVMHEIDTMVERYDIRELQFVDDIFNYDRDRTVAICEELLARPYRLHLVFPNGLRLDQLDHPLIRLMVRAGLDRLLAPIETGSPRLQREIGKNLDLEKSLAAIREMKRLGVFVRLTVMLGFPGETYAEMKQTARVAFSVPAQLVSVTQVAPLPGSAFGRKFSYFGSPGEWGHYNYIYTKINLSSVPLKKITRLKKSIYLHILAPHRLWWLLRVIPKRNILFYFQVFAAKLWDSTPGASWNLPQRLRKKIRNRLRGAEADPRPVQQSCSPDDNDNHPKSANHESRKAAYRAG